MLRTLGALVAGATICAVGLLSAHAQETKKSEKAEIPGGIDGTIKAVDKEKGTVSVLTTEGSKTRTFTVTDETTIVGARGGKVRKRLNDRRFREGLDITVVATGTTAKELHLGIYRADPSEPTEKPKTVAKKRMSRKEREDVEAEAAKIAAKKSTPKTGATPAPSIAAEEEDEDNEIDGKVKSYDTGSGRHLLVVTLLNGKGRTFFLSKDVKVLVKGKATKDGLMDSAIKAGAPVTVLTDAGGHKVLELHVAPPPPAKTAPAKTKTAA